LASDVVFGGKFRHFEKNIMKKEYFVTNSPFYEKKTSFEELLKIVTIAYKMKGQLIVYFKYHQSWLNRIMDDHHLSKITKLKKKTHTHTQKH
jgi:hypothetical protein